MDIVKLKNFCYRSSLFSKNLLLAGAVWFFSVSCLGQNFVFAQTWQEELEQQFDIVETFDQLQDWRGAAGLRGYDFSSEHLPKKIDGSPSIWNFYDNWSYSDPVDDWIQNHGAANVWRGSGKSLRMDISQSSSEPKYGPSRFGLYFGSNTPGVANPYASTGVENSGYKEIYYFYMVKLPDNMFPTNNGGIWPNDTYKWWSYHKFNTMSSGFVSITGSDSDAAGAGGCRWEYGCSYILTELKMCGSACSSGYSNTFAQSNDIRIVDYTSTTQSWIQDDVVLKTGQGLDYMNRAAADKKWFGLEYHIVAGTPGEYNGSVEIWMYEEDGTEHLIHSSFNIRMMQEGTDLAYNKFFFGGNLSYQDDVEAQGLDTTYYIDDFIIDDKRIGPTYFRLLSGNTVPVMEVTNVQPSPGVWIKP